MTKTFKTAVSTIREATVAKLVAQEQVISRINLIRMNELTSVLQDMSDNVIDGTNTILAFDSSSENTDCDLRNEILSRIDDPHIRNAIISHLIVSDHLVLLEALQAFVSITNELPLKGKA